MRAAARGTDNGPDLSAMIREFDQLKGKVQADLDRLHTLAQQIDRAAVDNGDAHVSLVVRGTARHLAAMGQGLHRVRSLRTAERTNTFRREEERYDADLRQAAQAVLDARRAQRQIVVPEEVDS